MIRNHAKHWFICYLLPECLVARCVILLMLILDFKLQVIKSFLLTFALFTDPVNRTQLNI